MSDQMESPTQPLEGQPLDADAAAAQVEKKRKKKRDKIRSAWISFVGRIVAQIMGAVATIALGLLVVHHYRIPAHGDEPAPKPQAPVASSHARVATPGALSLAVLPLETYAGKAPEGFADAMTEALTADLSRVADLRVISRTSAMQYKAQRKAVPTIARELGVDLVLEGSITTAGGRVRIIAQLIDAKRDEHLWAESYDRGTSDLLSVQADVAKAIARGVSGAVNRARNGSIKQTSEPSLPAAAPPPVAPQPASALPQ
jgi:TolB-like protein